MYELRYSFNATTGLTVTPYLISNAGVKGATVSYVTRFELNGWYGFNIEHSDSYSGFLGFYDASNNLLAMFAVNPQEAEFIDAKLSLLRSIGPGGVTYTYNVFNTLTNFPIVDALVWVTTDVDGHNVVGGFVKTDSEGNAVFELPAGTYYFWTRHSRYKFSNPDVKVVS